jgi:hypothetical protein
MSAADDPYEAESELVTVLCAGEDAELLADLFVARTGRWPYPTPYELAPFSDLFGYRRSRGAIPTPVAFALIPAAVQLVLAQEPGKRLEWAFELLGGLARASDTTELPPALATHWETLQLRAAALPSDDLTWRYLREWYRRA